MAVAGRMADIDFVEVVGLAADTYCLLAAAVQALAEGS